MYREHRDRHQAYLEHQYRIERADFFTRLVLGLGNIGAWVILLAMLIVSTVVVVASTIGLGYIIAEFLKAYAG